MAKGHFQQGSVTGTGAAINVSLGFVPDTVILLNQDGSARMEWMRGMDDGSGFKQSGATASWAAANGISPYEGASTGEGFTIGTDADVNAVGEVIFYSAWAQE